jgi:hypothetical protein
VVGAAGGTAGGVGASGREPAQAGGRLGGAEPHAERGSGVSTIAGGAAGSDRVGAPADDQDDAGQPRSSDGIAGVRVGALGAGAADARVGNGAETAGGCDGAGGAAGPRRLVVPAS